METININTITIPRIRFKLIFSKFESFEFKLNLIYYFYNIYFLYF